MRIFLQMHLGLGDTIICNGLIRTLAQTNEVFVPVYNHNKVDVDFMFRDVKNIHTMAVAHDKHMGDVARIWNKPGEKVVRLGHFGEDYDAELWSESFYRQAGVIFEARWQMFGVERNKQNEVVTRAGDFALISEDPKRGFMIDREKLTSELRRVSVERKGVIFNWIGMIEKAKEIHCIEGGFACLVDSIPLVEGQRRVMHTYARESVAPSLREGWEFVDGRAAQPVEGRTEEVKEAQHGVTVVLGDAKVTLSAPVPDGDGGATAAETGSEGVAGKLEAATVPPEKELRPMKRKQAGRRVKQAA